MTQNGDDGAGPGGERIPTRGNPPAADLLERVQHWLTTTDPAGGPSAAWLFVPLLTTVAGAWTCRYTVPSDSVAVIQRFGKYIGDVPPGLHFKLPSGVETGSIVPTERQLKQEFGFATTGATDPYQHRNPVDAKREPRVVTGDLNAALVEWVTQFLILNRRKLLLEVREPSETLRHVSESVMREVVGERTVDEVITIGRQEIESAALVKMQALATKYGLGISIDQVELKNINPPEPVQASFNAVNHAQQEKEELMNEAEGDVARFEALLKQQQRAPEVTERRTYDETIEDVLPKLQAKFIVDDQLRGFLPISSLEGGMKGKR